MEEREKCSNPFRGFDENLKKICHETFAENQPICSQRQRYFDIISEMGLSNFKSDQRNKRKDFEPHFSTTVAHIKNFTHGATGTITIQDGERVDPLIVIKHFNGIDAVTTRIFSIIDNVVDAFVFSQHSWKKILGELFRCISKSVFQFFNLSNSA